MDESAEHVSTANAIKLDYLGKRLVVSRRRHAQRWPLLKRAMRPVPVVVHHVRGEHVLKVAATNDQDPVEALAADAADPALGMRSWRTSLRNMGSGPVDWRPSGSSDGRRESRA